MPAPAVLPVSAPAARSVGLALLRLRLRLALLTMAILPVAISLALVFAVVGTQGIGERVQAGFDSAAISASISTQLDRTSTVLLMLASDPSIADRVATDSPDAALARYAQERLSAAIDLDAPGVTGVVVTDRAGTVRLRHGAVDPVGSRAGPPLGTVLALEPGSIARSSAYVGPNGDRRIAFLSPVAARDGSITGSVRVEVSVDRLVDQALSAVTENGHYMLVVETATGAVLGDSRERASAGGAAPMPDTVDAMVPALASGSQDALDALFQQGWAAGVANVPTHVRELAGWSVIIFEPAVPQAFPLELIVALGLLAVLVVGLTVWMSRQILRPAEELETSRHELKRLYESAREDSLRDALTGLGNHRAFQEELDRQLEWYRRYHVPLALMLIDMDDLKLVNDSRGHAAGDEMLRHMGRIIGEVVRYADRAFRIGGDEFAILMPHTDTDGAMQLGQRLQARAGRAVANAAPVSFSAGISACPALASTRAQLYTQADAALYWCKRHGRSSIDVFDPLRDRESDQTSTDELTASVMRVATERLLRPVYQPIVDMVTGRILGFEGLIRPAEGSGFDNPASLFAAADAVGRTVELDQACLDIVAAGARAIPNDLVVTINLSPRTVEAPQFGAAFILGALMRHGIDPRRVVIELTEREDVQDLARLRRNMADLQAAGIRIAADDVGAGNAGLRLLSQFRFDIVKIDLSLVQEGAQRASSRAVLRSLRDLAGRWHAFVIAEGLETAEQLRVVRELGIGAGQGYLLGRPGATINTEALDLDGLQQGHLMLQAAPLAPPVNAAGH